MFGLRYGAAISIRAISFETRLRPTEYPSRLSRSFSIHAPANGNFRRSTLKQLIIGGSRSGKSRLAEQHALACGLPVTYIATATAGDEEMATRILEHQSRRPAEWALVEEPLRLADALQHHAAQECCLLVDCLTLWLSNLVCGGESARLDEERNRFLKVLPELPGHIILVASEVGMGIVPMGELSRRFSAEAGWLNQSVASICDEVTLTVAGLPYPLKR